jgi:hypothetical protein
MMNKHIYNLKVKVEKFVSRIRGLFRAKTTEPDVVYSPENIITYISSTPNPKFTAVSLLMLIAPLAGALAEVVDSNNNTIPIS